MGSSNLLTKTTKKMENEKDLSTKNNEEMENEKDLSTITSEDLNKIYWADLPFELLSYIAVNLGFLDLLSFRGVCQQWRIASSEASAEIESDFDRLPWFLLYGHDPYCSLIVSSSYDVYKIHIPEFNSANCIASKDGWLLLYQNGSIFFFCPFSGAKIHLPKISRNEEISDNHVATFSPAPTSPNCVVCVGIKSSDIRLELYVLRRKFNEWVKYEYVIGIDLPLKFATLCSEELYFISEKYIILFNLSNEKWMLLELVTGNANPAASHLPFWTRRKHFKQLYDTFKQLIGLKDCDYLSICGTEVNRNPRKLCIINEEIKADVETGISVCNKKGIWFHPRFYQLPSNHTWSL